VRDKICNRYKNEIIGNYNNGINQNEGNEQINILRQEIGVINTIPHSSVNINNPDIVHQGYIDTNKHQDCVRLLSLNPRGFGPDDDEKVAMMIQSVKKYKIDVILLSLPDRKWSMNKIEAMKNKFKRISKEVEIITSNSNQAPKTSSGYLPGGTVSVLLGRAAGLKKLQSERTDSLG